jgi:transposase
MEADSLDLRQRVLAAVDAGGHPRTELAALFRVGVAWIRRLVQRRRETGSIAPPPRLLCRGGHRPSRYMNLRTALE